MPLCHFYLQVLRNDNQIRNADVELQQRAVEYLQLSTVATVDVLVSTCLHISGGDRSP